MKDRLADRRQVDQIWLLLFSPAALFLLIGTVISGTIAHVDNVLGTMLMAAAGAVVIAHLVLAAQRRD